MAQHGLHLRPPDHHEAEEQKEEQKEEKGDLGPAVTLHVHIVDVALARSER